MIIVGCGFLGKAAAQLFTSRGDRVLGIVGHADSQKAFVSSHHELYTKGSTNQRSSCNSKPLFPSSTATAVSTAYSLQPTASICPTGRIVTCDITNPVSVKTLTPKIDPPSLMIYAVSSKGGGPEAYAAIYRDGLKRTLDAWKPQRVIFVSSTSVYAQREGEYVTEESPTEPERETSRLLLEAENIALASGGIVARFAGIYGPGRSVYLKKFLSGEATLEEAPRWINQIHRDDGAKALLCLGLSENTSGIYNVCDDTPATQHQVYQWIASHCNKSLPPIGPVNFNRKRGWTSKRISNQKLRATGWKPDFPSYRNALSRL
ncbi:MAG TPA: NAD-dependent epimerase/dehydratase family protein [Chthoniobacterales bacterium]|nr:NAD-dependent epimerase/dehydratase family protein [Chthoniobacterales bacterium]